MSDEKSLVPVEQKSVSFYGDDIVAVRARGRGSYVPVRPICDLPGVDWSSQRQRMDYLSGFLFGISADRVKPDIRERLIQHRRECHKVLAEAFTAGLPTADPTVDNRLRADTPAALAYKMARRQVILRM